MGNRNSKKHKSEPYGGSVVHALGVANGFRSQSLVKQDLSLEDVRSHPGVMPGAPTDNDPFSGGDGAFAYIVAAHMTAEVPVAMHHTLLGHMDGLAAGVDDYRDAEVMGRGEHSRIHDLIDPSLHVVDNAWVPAEFAVGESVDEVHVASDIAGLNRRWHADGLYVDLAHVFSGLLPLFQHVLGRSLLNSSLKVIVKAQSYQIGQGGWYEGEMHKEGVPDDGIAAVGIYYYHVDEAMKGGRLQLAIPVRGGCGNRYVREEEIGVCTHKCVVFNNNVAFHKVGMMRNRSDDSEPIERKIIAFFLLNPDNDSLPSSATVPVNVPDGTRQAIADSAAGAILLPELQEIVADYASETSEEARAKREAFRRARVPNVYNPDLHIRTGYMD